MKKRLTTIELENRILPYISEIESKTKVAFKINFSQKDKIQNDTFSVYSDIYGYHFVYRERGKESFHWITDIEFDIMYWVLSVVVSSCSSLAKGGQTRTEKFLKERILLGELNEAFGRRYETELKLILKNYPL